MGDVVSELCIKWSGKEFKVAVQTGDTVGILKHKLQDLTLVQPKRQKLLGLKTKDGKPVGDDVAVAELMIKPNAKIMMMGTAEHVIEQTAKAAEEAPEVQDDFDVGADEEGQLEMKDRPEFQEKLQRRIASVQLEVISPPRPGKKALVLDIDYTIFDLGSTAERPEHLARPHLHEFLTACYEYYDLIIWSATSKKWVEVKMRELGVLGNDNYKVVCLMDHTSMVTVATERHGVFDCKPLQLLWAKFPGQYTEENTVMLDDLRRNFICNKQQGLVIRPYRKSHINRHTDRELVGLRRYLTRVGRLETLSHLNHRHWESYIAAGADRYEPPAGDGPGTSGS